MLHKAMSPRIERLEARLDRQQKELFERAAALKGCSLSNFVIQSVLEASIKTIREHEVIELTGPDRDLFIKTLLNPPKPSKRLYETAARYKKGMGI